MDTQARRPHDNPLDPKRPFQTIHRLTPEAMIATLRGVARAGRNTALPPDPHDARMGQVYAPLAVQPIEAFDDIIRFAGALGDAFSGGDAGTITPGRQGGHGPEPRFFGRSKRLRAGQG